MVMGVGFESTLYSGFIRCRIPISNGYYLRHSKQVRISIVSLQKGKEEMDNKEHICKLIECKLVGTEKEEKGIYNIKIEVVGELVRCKDCKHWEREKLNGNELWYGTCYSIELLNCINGNTYNVDNFQTGETFYCGFAERAEK